MPGAGAVLDLDRTRPCGARRRQRRCTLPATNAHRAWNALLDSAGVSVSKLHTNQTLLEKKEIQVQNESFFLKEEKNGSAEREPEEVRRIGEVFFRIQDPSVSSAGTVSASPRQDTSKRHACPVALRGGLSGSAVRALRDARMRARRRACCRGRGGDPTAWPSLRELEVSSSSVASPPPSPRMSPRPGTLLPARPAARGERHANHPREMRTLPIHESIQPTFLLVLSSRGYQLPRGRG